MEALWEISAINWKDYNGNKIELQLLKLIEINIFICFSVVIIQLLSRFRIVEFSRHHVYNKTIDTSCGGCVVYGS